MRQLLPAPSTVQGKPRSSADGHQIGNQRHCGGLPIPVRRSADPELAVGKEWLVAAELAWPQRFRQQLAELGWQLGSRQAALASKLERSRAATPSKPRTELQTTTAGGVTLVLTSWMAASAESTIATSTPDTKAATSPELTVPARCLSRAGSIGPSTSRSRPSKLSRYWDSRAQGAGIGVGDVDHHQLQVPAELLAGTGDGGANLGGMVGVIVDDRDSPDRP